MVTTLKLGSFNKYVYVRRYFIYPFPDDEYRTIIVEQKKSWFSQRWQRPVLINPVKYMRDARVISLYMTALSMAYEKVASWQTDTGKNTNVCLG